MHPLPGHTPDLPGEALTPDPLTREHSPASYRPVAGILGPELELLASAAGSRGSIKPGMARNSLCATSSPRWAASPSVISVQRSRMAKWSQVLQVLFPVRCIAMTPLPSASFTVLEHRKQRAMRSLLPVRGTHLFSTFKDEVIWSKMGADCWNSPAGRVWKTKVIIFFPLKMKKWEWAPSCPLASSLKE